MRFTIGFRQTQLVYLGLLLRPPAYIFQSAPAFPTCFSPFLRFCLWAFHMLAIKNSLPHLARKKHKPIRIPCRECKIIPTLEDPLYTKSQSLWLALPLDQGFVYISLVRNGN